MGKTYGNPELYIPAGEDWERTFTKKDANDNLIDLTGREYKLVVKANPYDADADAVIAIGTTGALDYEGNPMSGITNNGASGTLSLSAARALTTGLSLPDAVYDFWEKKAGGEWKLQARGKAIIEQNISHVE